MARERQGADRALEEAIDRLFTTEPSGFVAARDELVARLKAEGRASEAVEVRALRRPTVAAWAVNQVVRAHPAELEELFAAGADLRAAQRKALSGVRADGFREAAERRRRAIGALAQGAERALKGSGHGSAAVLEGVAATFDAASLDERAEELVRGGRLSRELPPPSGFGAVAGFEIVAEPPEAAAEPDERAGERSRRDADREARDRAAEASRARRRAMKARADADRAGERADSLRRQSQEAAARAKEAADIARAAEREADRLQVAAERAATASERPARGGGTRARTARASRPAPRTR